MGEFFTKIAGVTYAHGGTDPQGLLRRCNPKQELKLIRDPKNQYDKHAIKVCLTSGEQLGWIGKDVAERLSEDIDSGKTVAAEISEVTGGGFLSGKSRGCNIKITVG